MLAQYPWCLVICCLLIRVIPNAGVASHCPMVGVMTIVNCRCLCKQETHSNFHCHDRGYFYECMYAIIFTQPPAVVGILYKDIVVLMYMAICPL